MFVPTKFSTAADKAEFGNDISGEYFTAVGDAEGIYDLSGRTNEDNTVLGFSVAWQNSYGNSESVTAWSGEYHSDEDVIVTTWLLTIQTEEANDWKSTTVPVAKHQEDRQRQVQAFAVALTYDMVRFSEGTLLQQRLSATGYSSS